MQLSQNNAISKFESWYRFVNRVRVSAVHRPKKWPAQPEGRRPERDRKILRRCMSRSPYKPRVPPEDRVAVLWEAPAAHSTQT